VKLLIYGINYRPESVGVGKYTSEMAEWLARRGHQINVVTGPPHYPQWKVAAGYRSSRYVDEDLAGVRVRRCPMWLPQHYSPFKRIVSVVSFAITSFLPLLRAAAKKPDWIMVIEPSFFSVPGAWIASRILRVPLWLHVQDFELSAARSLGLVKGGVLLRIASAIESWFLRRPDRVSTLSEAMIGHLARAGVPERRRILFPNWVDCSIIHPLDTPSAFRAELGIPNDKTVLMYSGSFGRKHGLELLIAVARHLQADDQLHFVLCGEGSEKKRLRDLAHDLSNITWLPLQPKERLNDLLNLADVHLLPQRGSVASVVLPSKLGGMLASGRPVIATAAPGTRLAEIVEQTGIVVPPNDTLALAEAIIKLWVSEDRRRSLGAAARRHAEEHYGEDVILQRLEQVLSGHEFASSSCAPASSSAPQP
jgi:colanic acid biosynthesis glycosyl transferase WcaI